MSKKFSIYISTFNKKYFILKIYFRLIKNQMTSKKKLLNELCEMPEHLRGISKEILLNKYEKKIIDEALNEKIIKIRKWHDGPGEIIIPTEKGLDLYKKK